jgi:hypothetical protein
MCVVSTFLPCCLFGIVDNVESREPCLAGSRLDAAGSAFALGWTALSAILPEFPLWQPGVLAGEEHIHV